ncbi:MAG: peptidoglycan editing factor PgeF [Armatimonadetes bacterium]|nr:peptidoglycan editing factor PgeF [Armatimonadota bacterium]
MTDPTESPLQIHTVFPDFLPGIIHGYSTRGGGTSDAPYASLNLGDHVGDDPHHVDQNRLRLTRALGLYPLWVTAEQVHGGDVARVKETDAGEKIPGVDALITRTPRLPLALMYADCASVYFFDPERRAIGLAHAGWRGTAADIAGNTVRAMVEAFGSRPEDLWAGLGPHIGACCYTVGEEVVQALEPWEGSILRQRGRIQVDLGASNRAQLREAGVREDRILAASPCTACNTDRFFSYRREGATGRMAAVLMLTGK